MSSEARPRPIFPATCAVLQRLDGPALLFGAAEGLSCYTVAEIEHERTLAGRGLAANAPVPPIHMPPDRPSIVPEVELDHRTWAMAVSPDRRWLATGTHNHVVHLWDARTMKLVRSMVDDGADNAIWSLVFSSDSRWLASGSARGGAGRIQVCDVATGDTVWAFAAHERTLVRSLAFHPGQPLLVSSGDDGCLYMWDVGQRKPLGLLHRFPQSVWSLAFRPDGQRLAAACFDGTVALWDTSTLPTAPAAPQQVLTGPTNRVMSVGFSGDGRYLASGSDQGLIDLWNGQTFAHEVTLRGGGGEIRSLSFSPDDALLAGDAYGPSIVWDLANLRRTLAEMGLDW